MVIERKCLWLSSGSSIIAIVFILAACGIQDIPYYYPPTLTDSGISANTFSVNNDVRNYDFLSSVQYFVGYEIYYRAFSSSSDALSSISSMQAQIDSSDGSPSQAYVKLESLGFKRVYNADSIDNPFDDRPILKNFDASAAFYFTVFLKDSEEWFFTTDGADPAVLANRHYLRRFPSGSTSSQPFYLKSEYLSGDVDYSGSSSSPETIYFVFYGVAYGQDPQSPLTFIPSYPSYSTTYFTF